MLKDSRTTTVGLLPSPGGSLFVKRYNYQGLGYALKDLFRPSRARRVWIVANSLRMRGIPTPLVHTYLERRRFGFLLESYLITEGVEGIGLPEWLSRIHKSGASFLAKRLLITEIASVVRKLHTRGVSHRDLKGRNILILEKVPGRFEPLLVDLDGVRFGRVWLRRRAQDLARLAQAMSDQSAVTRTDRVRFLQAYLGPRGRASWKKLWSGIAMIQARLARSNASRRQ
jgi:tRNA A-37 threonylcarbamoyl transferase component Bud32